jgi:hypothetical protein
VLIHINCKSFLIGALILMVSVPFCFSQHLSLQTVSGAELRNNLPVNAVSDKHSLYLQNVTDSLKSDTTISKPAFKKFRMKKSPWVAVGLSAILPGAGQFYNQSYWKVPILLGIAGYLGYEYYDYDKKYRDYRDQYAASQSPQFPEGDDNLKTLREFYRSQRNDFVWYLAIVYVINLVDAYVDAHLFDFNVKEDKIERFGTIDKEYKLNVRFRF